ncbi:MAG: CHAT domain-containing protein [bacterium]|nr:CHAT domain-containing protein [bacterium]
MTKEPNSRLPLDFAGYRRVPWLGTRQPITTLPSIASLLALRRSKVQQETVERYLGYGNPLLEGNPGCLPATAIEQPCEMKASGPRNPRRVRNADLDTVFNSGGDRESALETVRRLCPLPDTGYEITCVANHFGVEASSLRLGSDATEADIKTRDDLEEYSVLHFATHGLIAGDVNRMMSRQGEAALVLTPPTVPTDSSDDGLLTASEVSQLRLNADWVVLSACNTASGDVLGAEALSGLASAFIYAGSRALLVSHWPVYSDAAVALTTRAFAEMAADESVGRAEAIRRSMVALAESDNHDDNPHPAVWAPFVVVGEGSMRAIPQLKR